MVLQTGRIMRILYCSISEPHLIIAEQPGPGLLSFIVCLVLCTLYIAVRIMRQTAVFELIEYSICSIELTCHGQIYSLTQS